MSACQNDRDAKKMAVARRSCHKPLLLLDLEIDVVGTFSKGMFWACAARTLYIMNSISVSERNRPQPLALRSDGCLLQCTNCPHQNGSVRKSRCCQEGTMAKVSQHKDLEISLAPREILHVGRARTKWQPTAPPSWPGRKRDSPTLAVSQKFLNPLLPNGARVNIKFADNSLNNGC